LAKPKRIVVIGGTGNFGARICARLLGEPNTELIVTSRSAAKAELYAGELCARRPDAMVSAAALDQSAEDFEESLTRLGADMVIHTAGPYQGQDYRVARACIECRSHYIDLADGREFVQGFNALHQGALDHGVLLVSGASTLPGLSSAVIGKLEDRFASIRAVEISIAPAHQTPRGRGTVAAVLSYCGKPFAVFENGSWIMRYGWQHLRTQRYPDCGFRLSGACDVPDLALFPHQLPEVETVTFHAALEAKWEQISLWLMAWVTRMQIIRNWDRSIPAFQWLSDRLITLGSDTGGMQIRLSGIGRRQEPKTVTWNLTARRNHGPEIPCTPALIIARKLAADQLSLRGAYPCLGMITLSEFDTEVSDLAIGWTTDEESAA
jgi:hypothetical protein